MLQPGTLLHDRYEIQQELEHSSETTRYLAHDQHLDKLVIVKELGFQSDSFVKQFAFEARLLSSLNHAALPHVTDYFQTAEGHYLITEHISGMTLHDYLAKQADGRVNERTMLLIMLPVLDALEYLHNQQPPIIHRDVRPDNIYLGDHGKVYLVNFSFAKVDRPGVVTSIGAESVVPGFSPIEQYHNGSTDARSDLYALGATMYLMVTGKQPPTAIERVLNDTLQPPRDLNPELSPAIASILQRLLAPQAQNRYPDVASFRQDIPHIPGVT